MKGLSAFGAVLTVLIGAHASTTLLAGGDRAHSSATAEALLYSDCEPRGRRDSLVRLGEKLFFDQLLSTDSSISCATCHDPNFAFAENQDRSLGIGRDARRRNAPSLLGIGNRKSFGWDGRASTLTHQLDDVFSIDGDMGIEVADVIERLREDSSYQSQFRSLFGAEPEAESLFEVLSQYQRRLNFRGSAMERYVIEGDRDAVSTDAAAGWALFTSARAGCAGCHSPVWSDETGKKSLQLTDEGFHNLGVGYVSGAFRDPGRFGVTAREADLGAFKTPSLRNVSRTGPYMHDGSIKTLEEVIAFYIRGGTRNPHLDAVMHPRRLGATDSIQLLAFLHALTDDWLTPQTGKANPPCIFEGETLNDQ